jgi:hypothetical protein
LAFEAAPSRSTSSELKSTLRNCLDIGGRGALRVFAYVLFNLTNAAESVSLATELVVVFGRHTGGNLGLETPRRERAMKKLDDLKVALFAANDARVACDAINKLTKYAEKGSAEAKQTLAHYAKGGQIDHMREHACASLAGTVNETDAEFVSLFRQGLSDPAISFWSILGCINSAGRAAYADLVRLAEDETVRLQERAHAVKCLARSSGQRFDRGLPSNPGFWIATDLRIDEVRTWAKNGYPDGEGYSKPQRHAALDNPTTEFEGIVSRFDKKLAKRREDPPDFANPMDWLALAAPEDMQRIKAKWDLPSLYLDFLTRFSPVKVVLESQKFYNGFQLFGAAELIEAQDGYSFNPIEQQPIEDWPAHFVVIASHGGDPYVLDLSKSDGNDAPIKTAQHGTGFWKFRQIAASFHEFLQQLAK